MKETYLKPNSDIEEFKTGDIITTSGEPDTDITVPWS